MKPLSIETLEQAAQTIAPAHRPTPQIHWPLLDQRSGCEVWVKHENHNPTGAFKVRGGLNFMARLKQQRPDVKGVITATRGNHGQSIGLAAAAHQIHAVIVVPEGNNPEKNAAMSALGVELIEYGNDFQAAREYAMALAEERGLLPIPPFHEWLVAGVASYALEFLRAAPPLDTVYVPIGQGSGICGLISARDALGLKTRIVGVVAEGAPSYALSFEAGKAVETAQAATIADGVACRIPDQEALEMILSGVERVIRVSEAEILAAMRHYFTDTHNLAEGAGATPLAALLQERETMAGKRVGLILSGGNADRALFHQVLS